VKKEEFIPILSRYWGSSIEEAEEILSLQEAYPFSQVLHALAARVSKDHGFAVHQQVLQLAAVYASYRSVLKDIMSREYNPEIIQTPQIANTPAAIIQAYSNPVIQQHDDVDDLAAEVMEDLERLNVLRHNFEMMFAETNHANNINEAANHEQSVEVHEKDSGKSKKERIIELAKSLNSVPEKVSFDIQPPRIKGKRRKKDDDENIIEEIVISKEVLTPENEKQKEQLLIIDQFIKIQPSITSAKEKQSAAAGDLSTIKTGEFGDNIVSETLVEILLKQGKKDKAIEVLKKLIWKFPQKKAYFASQIEELRK
jgi:hypothetical protein